jgi:hypothetical protein
MTLIGRCGVMSAKTVLAVWALALLSGCTSIGPKTLVADRFGYNAAIADSWKSQMLLNIVKVRYGDAPIFLDVASVINSYQLSGTTSVGASFNFQPYSSGINVSQTGSFANSPTITYSPLTGERFTRSMMTPLPTSTVLFLIQAGYPADGVFRALVQSVNGIRNRYGGSGRQLPADPAFYVLIKELREIQDSGALELRVQKVNGRETTLLVLGGKRDEKAEADGRDFRKMLGLDPQARELNVVYGSLPSGDKEIALLTRSVLQVVVDLGSFVEVPDAQVAEKRVLQTLGEKTADGSAVRPIIRIHSGTGRPDDAFVAVPYQGYWFWIDNRDLMSKTAFSFIMFIFNLVDTRTKEGIPVVTIPAR